MSLKRIMEEEAELDKEFLGEGNPTSEGVTTEPTTNVNSFEVQTEPQPKTDLQDTTSSEEETYKKRFTNYKASTDKTISNLRKENSQLIATLQLRDKKIDELSLTIAELRNKGKDPFGDSITQSDIDQIGPEAIDIIKRANKKATELALSPMQDEINRLKARELESIKRQAEERNKQEYNYFISDLGKAVPDYATINLDSNFEKFMLEVDPSTGEKRLDAFRRAEEYRDANRVADFFNEFKANIPKSKKDTLEDQLTPESSKASGSNTSNVKKDTFTIKEVEDFFNDIARGAYRKKIKEADEIEARITKAYMSGKIIG